VLAYHQGRTNRCVDLGCGHGIVSRGFAPFFTTVIGTDPSSGMLEQATSMTAAKHDQSNIDYQQAAAEELPFLDSGSVDMVVAGQAAHWFDYTRLFPELKRILRKGGTLAFWGYSDHVFVDHPKATEIVTAYAYGNDERTLGPYWQQPGRSIVQNKLRDIEPPTGDWENIQRIEYEPAAYGRNAGDGTLLLEKRMKLIDCENYIRTWSSYHGWQEKFPRLKKREAGGTGDVVDEMFDDIRKTEPAWQKDQHWLEQEVDIEWPSGLLLARRR
jgi:SAM-dependent methyltransferase